MPGKTIKFIVVGKSGTEDEFNMDAEVLSLHEVYQSLNVATSKGSMFTAKDNVSVLALNLANIESLWTEVEEG